MSIECRHVEAHEIEDFLALWTELLLALEKKGGDTATSVKSIGTYETMLRAVIENEIYGVALMAWDGQQPVAALLWCGIGETQLHRVNELYVYAWGSFTVLSHRRQGVTTMIRETAILALDAQGITEAVGSVILSNAEGFESSRKIGFVPTDLVGSLDVHERAEHIRHQIETGECSDRLTDGFYWEGPCPLCGRGKE